MDLKDQLRALLEQTELTLSTEQIEKLVAYVELLHKWNRAYNLTSVRQPEEMLVKHILDSLMVGSHIQGQRLIDVGTGPGLPGIPLAILYPEKTFFLLDSLGKRITFLRQVIFQLELKNVTTIKSRVEEFQPEVLFDGVLSRAFASLDDMVSWCQHLVAEHGRFYALKGQYPADEVNHLPDSIELVAGYRVEVPQLNAERHLLELKKINY